MRIEFERLSCRNYDRFLEEFTEVEKCERDCVEAVSKDPEHLSLIEGEISCNGPNPDGSCGRIVVLPSILPIKEELH